MMSSLPILSGKELIKVLKALGFEVIRQKGSHAFLRHLDGRTTVIPIHSTKDLDRGLLRKILRDVELSPEEFKILLGQKK